MCACRDRVVRRLHHALEAAAAQCALAYKFYPNAYTAAAVSAVAAATHDSNAQALLGDCPTTCTQYGDAS